MTLLELRSSVIANTRRTDKVAYINESINFALKEIVQFEPFKTLRSETDLFIDSLSNYVSLDGFIGQVLQVRLLPAPAEAGEGEAVTLSEESPGFDVPILDQRTIQQKFPDLQSQSSGVPQACYLTNNRIVFTPPVNKAYTVRVLLDSFAPKLENDDEVTPLPELDNAVIAWASARVFKSLGLWEDARGWEIEYEKALRLAKRADNREPGKIRQMRGAMEQRPRYIDPRINHYTRGGSNA